MKILIDHCLDWRLVRHLPGHDVQHTGKLGWGALKNGELLRKAEGSGFEVFITSDKNLQFQQNLRNLRLAVVVLDVISNRLEHCVAKCPLLLARLSELKAGTATVI